MAALTPEQFDEIGKLIADRTAALSALSKEQRKEGEDVIEKSALSVGLSPAQKWDAAMVFSKIGTGLVAVLGVAGYFLINSAAQVAAMSAAQKITATAAADQVVKDPNFIKSVQAGISALPKNSIVAFTNSQSCPAGWTDFTNGQGRTLIGATTSPTQQVSPMPIFPAANFVPGNTGGSQVVNITYALPSGGNVGNAVGLMPGAPVEFAS
jgi:hypothetical protein